MMDIHVSAIDPKESTCLTLVLIVEWLTLHCPIFSSEEKDNHDKEMMSCVHTCSWQL